MYNDAMSNPMLEFLGWEQSALELVGAKLLAMEKAEPDAFRRATVVVPTAESGRRLKEWMAATAAKPLLMPTMALVSQLVQVHRASVADELETLAAWVEVLTAQDPHEAWPQVFPQPVPAQHMQTWALGAAARLLQLQLQMEQYEVSVSALLGRITGGEDLPEDFAERWSLVADSEKERWLCLEKLFGAVDDTLAAWGMTPGWKARKEEEESPAPTEGAPIIIACLPELSPQVQRYLLRLEKACPSRVRIWVHAPGELREGFDALGCVKPSFWAKRELPDTWGDANITVQPSAQAMARAAVAAVGKETQENVVLASCDADFTPALVTEFAKYGWRVHIPEGRSYHTTDLAALPALLETACCAAEMNLAAMEPLLRNVAAQRLAGGAQFDSYRYGLLLDKIINRYLPGNVAELLRLLNPATHLPGMEDDFRIAEIDKLRKREFAAAAKWMVDFVKTCRRDMYHSLLEMESRLLHAYRRDALEPVARQMAARMRRMAHFLHRRPLPPNRAWALLRQVLGELRETLQESARERTQLDALGWRELAYAKGKKLILTGLHEGRVPELPAVDPFLPDTLRQLLGMPCARSRELRDAYLLESLLHRRYGEEKVEVQVVLSRSSADGSGTPVEPSSLLYRCSDSLLVSRVQHLFRELPVEQRADQYETWSLAPSDAEPRRGGMESVRQIAPHWKNKFSSPEHCFSPSQINAFLACPLRFWMKYALGVSPWEVYNPDKVEMEAAEYGTLMHAVLEALGNKYRTKDDLEPEDDMCAYAERCIRDSCTKMFGDRPVSAMVYRQMRRLSTSLRFFISWHRQQLFDGWECRYCEHEVKRWELPLPDGSTALISMRADRIDYNPKTDEWRIIDYKTHDRSPKEDHLERVPDKKVALFEELMGPAGFELLQLESGKKGGGLLPYRWRDVQLPMYAYWLMKEKKCTRLPQVAYYNLPRVGKDMPKEHAIMDLLDAAALDSALSWAESAILLMRAGSCLYSAETFSCHAFGTYSADEDMADPRALFHTLTPPESHGSSCNQ